MKDIKEFKVDTIGIYRTQGNFIALVIDLNADCAVNKFTIEGIVFYGIEQHFTVESWDINGMCCKEYAEGDPFSLIELLSTWNVIGAMDLRKNDIKNKDKKCHGEFLQFTTPIYYE